MQLGAPGSLVGIVERMPVVSERSSRSGNLSVEYQRQDMRQAWLVSMISVAWTVVAGTVAIVLGIAEHSAVLVALGSVGLVDAGGSAALAYHFRHGMRHEALAEHLETLAHRVVIVGLVCVGAAAVGLGAVRLLGQQEGATSGAALALAAVSLLVLLFLARAKHRLSVRVASPALRSDSHLSTVGATQALVALLGVLAAAVGWTWADPLAAIAVGTVAAVVGLRTWLAEHPRQGHRRVSPVVTALVFVAIVALVDALLGERLVIEGLLMFGLVIASLTMRPRAMVVVRVVTIVLAVALGIPNQIWMTVEHAIWIGSVSIAATVSTAVVALAAKQRDRSAPIHRT
jgi:hypothetical protein